MTTAHELLGEPFECLKNFDRFIDRCVDLFADGVFESPYLLTIGLEGRFEGKAAIRSLLELVQSRISSFTLSNIEMHDLVAFLASDQASSANGVDFQVDGGLVQV
jgi:hypothetical protein